MPIIVTLPGPKTVQDPLFSLSYLPSVPSHMNQCLTGFWFLPPTGGFTVSSAESLCYMVHLSPFSHLLTAEEQIGHFEMPVPHWFPAAPPPLQASLPHTGLILHKSTPCPQGICSTVYTGPMFKCSSAQFHLFYTSCCGPLLHSFLRAPLLIFCSAP